MGADSVTRCLGGVRVRVVTVAFGFCLWAAYLPPASVTGMIRDMPPEASAKVEKTETATVTVTVARVDDGENVLASEVVTAMARAMGLSLGRPPGMLRLPVKGAGRWLTQGMLRKYFGADLTLEVREREVAVQWPSPASDEARTGLSEGVRDLADHILREMRRREFRMGMHALPSYQPNNPKRPTVCLIHGLNSSSGVFVHLVPALEAAGYGIVVYDFPANQNLETTCRDFHAAWRSFRDQLKPLPDRQPWVILSHSLGGLPARSYVENDAVFRNDVLSLILIAPVNQGSAIAGSQSLLQLMQSWDSLNNPADADNANANAPHAVTPLTALCDGLGASAADLAPGSAFLTALNKKPRRPGVRYHILAGNGGLIAKPSDAPKDPQIRTTKTGDADALPPAETPSPSPSTSPSVATALAALRFAELLPGQGDGCVTVAGTKLEGADDPTVIHANHLELIRAPAMYPQPGPVVCMPYVLRWLEDDCAGLTHRGETKKTNPNPR